MIAFDTYLRPGEIDAIKVGQVVPPRDLSAEGTYELWSILVHPITEMRPGKTGLYDEAVLIDDPTIAPVLHWLTVNRALDEKVWQHKIAEELSLFNRAATALSLERLKPCRYSLRSHDFLTKRRARTDIKRRGRWKTDGSVRRYGKESMAMAQPHKVPREVRLYGARAAPILAQILMGPAAPPALPLLNSGRGRQ